MATPGGESVFGEPFKDEFHSRLHFNHRGQVAMANSKPNDNGSQACALLEAALAHARALTRCRRAHSSSSRSTSRLGLSASTPSLGR